MRNPYFLAAILLASFALCSTPVAAKQEQGTPSCGQWVAADNAHSVPRYEAEAWVRDLLTGMHAGKPAPAEHFIGEDADLARNRFWLNNFLPKASARVPAPKDRPIVCHMIQ
jgi:hypothetical protein